MKLVVKIFEKCLKVAAVQWKIFDYNSSNSKSVLPNLGEWLSWMTNASWRLLQGYFCYTSRAAIETTVVILGKKRLVALIHGLLFWLKIIENYNCPTDLVFAFAVSALKFVFLHPLCKFPVWHINLSDENTSNCCLNKKKIKIKWKGVKNLST